MDAGELLLGLHRAGVCLFVAGDRLKSNVTVPGELRAEVLRWRRVLRLLLALPVRQLREGMTADEAEAFDERAAVLEHDAGIPRELAERVALWWARTMEAERCAA